MRATTIHGVGDIRFAPVPDPTLNQSFDMIPLVSPIPGGGSARPLV